MPEEGRTGEVSEEQKAMMEDLLSCMIKQTLRDFLLSMSTDKLEKLCGKLNEELCRRHSEAAKE